MWQVLLKLITILEMRGVITHDEAESLRNPKDKK